MGIMKCPHCGRMMREGENCVHCGYKSSPKMISKLIPCKVCGKEISVSALSCPHCGEPTEYARKLEFEKENRNKVIEKEKSDQKAALAVTAVFGVILLIIGLVLIIVQASTISHDLNGWYYNYKGDLTSHETEVLLLLLLGIGSAVVGVIDLVRVKIKYDKLK